MATAAFGGKCRVRAQEWHDGQPEVFPPSSICPLGNELKKCYFSFLFHLECAKGAATCSIVYPWLCVQVAPAVSNSLGPHGLWPPRRLCPGDFPGKNTGVGCHALLQGIFLTQRSNPCLMFPALAGRFFITGVTWKVSHLWLEGVKLRIFFETVH